MAARKRRKRSTQKTLLLEIVKLVLAAIVGCASIPHQYLEKHAEGFCDAAERRPVPVSC